MAARAGRARGGMGSMGVAGVPGPLEAGDCVCTHECCGRGGECAGQVCNRTARVMGCSNESGGGQPPTV